MSAFQILGALVSMALIGFAIVVIERAQAIVQTRRALRVAQAARRHAPSADALGSRFRLRD